MRDYDFIKESNKIEGILEVRDGELEAFHKFMDLDFVTIPDIESFVSVYQPYAELRIRQGMDVRVGSHIPPPGGIDIKTRLEDLIDDLAHKEPYETHVRYEMLHPFTDCNGRSGRMLWAWQTQDISLGFLHRFYYQTLQARRGQ